MQNSNKGTKSIPTWLIAGLLLILALLFMEKALFPPEGSVLLGHDMRGLFYPWLNYAHDSVWAGRLPLWDVTQGSGYPSISNPQLGFFYPPTWFAILLPTRIGISLYVAFHIWLGALGMYLFVRHISKSEERWAGPLLAALTFGFGGYVVAQISAGHLGQLATSMWVPWMLLLSARSVEKRSWRSALWAGVPFGMAVLDGHTPTLIYFGLIWLAFVIYLLVTTRQWWLVIRQTAVSGIIGLMLGAVQLLPTIELILLSMRGSGLLEQVGQWSYPPAHLITLLIPGFFGDVKLGYWGAPAFDELTYYTGTLSLLALVLAIRKPTRRTWFYLTLMVVGLLIAIGKYGFLYQLLYDLLLPFRLVRVPARAAFLFVFAASALLGDVVTSWEGFAARDAAPLKPLMRWTLGIVAVLSVVAIATMGTVYAIESAQGAGETHTLQHLSGIVIAAAGLLIGGALLWRYLVTPPENVKQRRGLIAALAVLVVVDLWSFGFKIVELWPAAPLPMWQDAKAFIGDDYQRVVPADNALYYHRNESTLVGLYNVAGDMPLMLSAYHNFTHYVDDLRSHAYDVLAAGYVLTDAPLDDTFTQGDGALELVQQTDAAWIYRRPDALPMARLVYDAEVIANPDTALGRLYEVEFSPAETVILEQQPPCEIGSVPDEPGTAQILEARPGTWLIETSSDTPAVLVLAETDYPGWAVAIDGEKAETLTAYTTIRAVCVPAGTHRVEWRFVPISLAAGAAVTALAWVALLGTTLANARKKQND